MLKRSGILFLVLFGALACVSSLYTVQEECGPNEEYLLCGSACPFNCTEPEGQVVCDEECVEGCFCKNGYLRDVNGSCVPADKCIGDTTSICSANEEFLSCGSACPLTCSQPERPVHCGLACSMGCFCKAGYVRDEKSQKCVTLDQCPVEQCFNGNETFAICSASCEPSCNDPEPVCVQVCTSGCVCNDGLLRDDSGVCVSADECPPSNSTDVGLVGKYYDVINKILHLSTA